MVMVVSAPRGDRDLGAHSIGLGQQVAGLVVERDAGGREGHAGR